MNTEEAMREELEALRKEISPDIPPYAISFQQLMETMGPNIGEGRIRKWMAAEIRSGRWKKQQVIGGTNKFVFWKVGKP